VRDVTPSLTLKGLKSTHRICDM